MSFSKPCLIRIVSLRVLKTSQCPSDGNYESTTLDHLLVDSATERLKLKAHLTALVRLRSQSLILFVSNALECAYGLRYVEENGYGNRKDPWSVRQTAIYHKYEKEMGTWILISPSKQAKAKIIENINLEKLKTGVKNPFELHVVLLDTALANWRWYIKSLVEQVTEHSSRIVTATVGKGQLGLIDFEINFEDRQNLKSVEDKILDLLTIFESTTDTISTLLEEYEYMRHGSENTYRDPIVLKLRGKLREVNLYQKKAATLHKKIQGTASLVRYPKHTRRPEILADKRKLSDLLNYENAKVAQENGDSLKVLAEETREENGAMRMLAEKSTKDAAAVRL